jgi:hypothetical protein
MSRRNVGFVLLAALGCARGRQAPTGPPDLSIMYLAGLRGAVDASPQGSGGLARLATLVDQTRIAARSVVQLDGGDFTPAAEDGPGFDDPTTRIGRAELAMKAYRRMGVDAITVGERDLALGVATLKRICSEAKVSAVAANVIGDDGRPVFEAEKLLQAGAITLGVFGILETPKDAWTAPPGVTLADAVGSARAAVASLRAKGARLVVGLFHVASGRGRARQIADAVPGIDLVVLGHDGPSEQQSFVWSGLRGAAIGRIDARLPDRGPVRLEDHVLQAAPGIPEQLGVQLLVRLATGGPIAETFEESRSALARAAGHKVTGERWTYGSTTLCAGCHEAEAEQWKTTDHAQAFELLKARRHDREPACMGCHMTGFLLPGGAQNFETAIAQFTNVGCEACHGPSVAHVLSKDKHQGTRRAVAPQVCLGCHTPDQNRGPFIVADAMKEVIGPGHGRAPSPAP